MISLDGTAPGIHVDHVTCFTKEIIAAGTVQCSGRWQLPVDRPRTDNPKKKIATKMFALE